MYHHSNRSLLFLVRGGGCVRGAQLVLQRVLDSVRLGLSVRCRPDGAHVANDEKRDQHGDEVGLEELRANGICARATGDTWRQQGKMSTNGATIPILQ
jgi:hypothetical protein